MADGAANRAGTISTSGVGITTRGRPYAMGGLCLRRHGLGAHCRTSPAARLRVPAARGVGRIFSTVTRARPSGGLGGTCHRRRGSRQHCTCGLCGCFRVFSRVFDTGGLLRVCICAGLTAGRASASACLEADSTAPSPALGPASGRTASSRRGSCGVSAGRRPFNTGGVCPSRSLRRQAARASARAVPVGTGQTRVLKIREPQKRA